jgi:hydrogenase expression/formation protein HypE
VRIEESALPVRREVRAACELLGLDPLHVACEGRLVAVLPRADSDRALSVMRDHPKGRHAALIGEVSAEDPGLVVMTSRLGSLRIVSPLTGEQLPRIC